MDHFLIFLGFSILSLRPCIFGGQFSPIQSARPCQFGQFGGLVYAEHVSGNPWCLMGKGVLQIGGPKPRVFHSPDLFVIILFKETSGFKWIQSNPGWFHIPDASRLCESSRLFGRQGCVSSRDSHQGHLRNPWISATRSRPKDLVFSGAAEKTTWLRIQILRRTQCVSGGESGCKSNPLCIL